MMRAQSGKRICKVPREEAGSRLSDKLCQIMVIERACAGKYGDAGNDGDNENAKDKLSNRGNGIATALKNERKTLTSLLVRQPLCLPPPQPAVAARVKI
jgi:hypothetical protein